MKFVPSARFSQKPNFFLNQAQESIFQDSEMRAIDSPHKLPLETKNFRAPKNHKNLLFCILKIFRIPERFLIFFKFAIFKKIEYV